MFKFNCPSCGAENIFRSVNSLFVVCLYCKASLFKTNDEIRAIGKAADTLEDNSPLQLRSEGIYQNKKFSVIGRIRLKWAAGFWNEWCVLFNDNSYGWLAEAQGEFLFTKEVLSPSISLASVAWEVKKKVTIENAEMIIADIKHAEICMIEGELPYAAQIGDKRTSADLRPQSGPLFGSLEKDSKNPKVKAYLGNVVDLSDLKMTYLRDFDAW